MASSITDARHLLRRILIIAVTIASSACGAKKTPSDAAATALSAQAEGTNDFTLRAIIAVPGNPLKAFDISWVDSATRRYYLADRSNAGVDVFDTRRNTFLVRAAGDFAGADPRGNDFSGPNGIVVIHDRAAGGRSDDDDSREDEGESHHGAVRELWAGDGPRALHSGETPQSSVKVFDLNADPPALVATIPTGGTRRSDEMAFDPRDHILAVVNNADDPAFVSLISTRPPRRVLARITFAPGQPGYPFTNAVTGGLEQPAWNAKNRRFYVSVPELDGDAAKGAVALIDPVARKVTNLIPVSQCSPAGLSFGPHQHFLVGCADPSRSVILDAKAGAVFKTILDVGGSDEVWFNPGDRHYYLAARNDPSGPKLAVIDADTNAFIEKVPTSFNAHSVAADRVNNHVFVPLTPPRAGKEDPDPCTSFGGPAFAGRGCIGVYWSPDRHEDEDED